MEENLGCSPSGVGAGCAGRASLGPLRPASPPPSLTGEMTRAHCRGGHSQALSGLGCSPLLPPSSFDQTFAQLTQKLLNERQPHGWLLIGSQRLMNEPRANVGSGLGVAALCKGSKQ